MSEERKKHISILKNMLEWMEVASKVASKEERKEAVKYAISSLETDEAYQLEYERTTKNDLGVDCISRADARKAIIDHQYSDNFCEEHNIDHSINTSMALIALSDLPPVTPQEPRKGKWLRMSDLSEQEDDRYKCSCCGNVVHYTNKINLYTFNNWCGRCGSDNGIHIHCEVEE